MEKRKLVLTIIGVVILAMVIMVYIYFSKPGRDEKKNQQTINQVQTVQQKTNEKKENTEKNTSAAAQNDRAEIRRLEPYCYGQFTEGKASPNFGRSHVHWLTGTASTVMVGCVEGILGMRPDFYGLHVAPSIPKEWDGFEIEKDFRGKHLHITVKNPNHTEAGCTQLIVNGQKVDGDYIPEELLTEQTQIELTM